MAVPLLNELFSTFFLFSRWCHCTAPRTLHRQPIDGATHTDLFIFTPEDLFTPFHYPFMGWQPLSFITFKRMWEMSSVVCEEVFDETTLEPPTAEGGWFLFDDDDDGWWCTIKVFFLNRNKVVRRADWHRPREWAAAVAAGEWRAVEATTSWLETMVWFGVFFRKKIVFKISANYKIVRELFCYREVETDSKEKVNNIIHKRFIGQSRKLSKLNQL